MQLKRSLYNQFKLPVRRNFSKTSANRSLKRVDIETMKQTKKRQQDSLQPSFQIHNQEGHNDRSLTGMIQLCHDPSKTVTPFTLTGLPFNANSVDFALMG